jgi:hypothetical protein
VLAELVEQLVLIQMDFPVDILVLEFIVLPVAVEARDIKAKIMTVAPAVLAVVWVAVRMFLIF